MKLYTLLLILIICISLFFVCDDNVSSFNEEWRYVYGYFGIENYFTPNGNQTQYTQYCTIQGYNVHWRDIDVLYNGIPLKRELNISADLEYVGNIETEYGQTINVNLLWEDKRGYFKGVIPDSIRSGWGTSIINNAEEPLFFSINPDIDQYDYYFVDVYSYSNENKIDTSFMTFGSFWVPGHYFRETGYTNLMLYAISGEDDLGVKNNLDGDWDGRMFTYVMHSYFVQVGEDGVKTPAKYETREESRLKFISTHYNINIDHGDKL